MNPEYSLEGMILRRPEEKGVTENKMFGCIIDPVDMSLSKLQEIVRDRESDVL